jgi:redox-sensitive bicupin YhaK (pirin superfamily)
MTVADHAHQGFDVATSQESAVSAGPQRIAFRTGGRQHGPITCLVSPSQVGELIKPFVFTDHGEVEPTGQSPFGIHPHSGIATLTVVLGGRRAYEDTTGKKGEVVAGGLEWMKAGNGVWHDGWVAKGKPMRFYQLWIALPESEENAPPPRSSLILLVCRDGRGDDYLSCAA